MMMIENYQMDLEVTRSTDLSNCNNLLNHIFLQSTLLGNDFLFAMSVVSGAANMRGWLLMNSYWEKKLKSFDHSKKLSSSGAKVHR